MLNRECSTALFEMAYIVGTMRNPQGECELTAFSALGVLAESLQCEPFLEAQQVIKQIIEERDRLQLDFADRSIRPTNADCNRMAELFDELLQGLGAIRKGATVEPTGIPLRPKTPPPRR